MAFLSPLFLIGGLAAALPIVLHLLKRQPDVRVRFSAVRFLQSAPVETSERRRLRELLLLALRVAALLLLALAFARPFVASGGAAGSAGVTIVALDTSLSMSAPGRFARARELAKGIVRASGRDWTGLVLFDTSARIARPLSTDREAVLAAIDAAEPGRGATRYRVALRAAADLLRGRAGRIVVVSDLQASGWDAGDRAVLPEEAKVEVVDVGALDANLAVTVLRVSDDRLLASVRNSGAAPREAHLRLHVHTTGADGSTALAAETTVPVAPGQTADAVFALPRAQWAVVSVDDPSGVAADNARYLVLDASARTSVLVVTASGEAGRDGLYVEQALVAGGAESGAFNVEDMSGLALQGWDQARLDAHTAVVLLSTRGLDHHGRELLSTFLRKGGGLLLAAGVDVDSEVISDILQGKAVVAAPANSGGSATVGNHTLAPVDTRHPVLRVFGGRASLALVKFQRVSGLRAPDCQLLARFTSGEAALVDCAIGEGRVLVFASDLSKSGNDFPLHATFVPFVHESIRYLARGHVASDYIVGEVPSGVANEPGVVSYTARGGAAPRLVAVNVDPAESDLSRLTPEQFQTAITRSHVEPGVVEQSEARDQEDRQHIWQYVLVVMLAAMAIESVVAARTA